ncbi:MAG TPA: NADPH-dependent F420 reductase [Acidimicrobiales bacterium]|nr:NADPH-dependent F420 reductase [Acidimicrobiales bacterium]
MRVGILGGTGPLGRGLALRLADAGAEVVIGSRHAERATEVVAELLRSWPGRRLRIEGAANDAAADAELVVLSTPWEAAVPTAGQLTDALESKVVVSVANALVRQGREMHALVPPRGSVAAGVQSALPGSLVSAAGHHLPAQTLADLDAPLEEDVLVCADAEAAKAPTMELFATVDGLRPVDAGSLASAAAVEAFTAVLVTVNIRYKAHTTLRLGGLPARGAGGRP